MMSLEQIREMSKEQARKAKRLKQVPFIIVDEDTVQDFPPFPFPNIGDYRPKGWKLVDELLVDSSGCGSESEPALTAHGCIARLKVGRGYAIIAEGQFQVVVGEFVKK